jgi:hypothetical protein
MARSIKKPPSLGALVVEGAAEPGTATPQKSINDKQQTASRTSSSRGKGKAGQCASADEATARCVWRQRNGACQLGGWVEGWRSTLAGRLALSAHCPTGNIGLSIFAGCSLTSCFDQSALLRGIGAHSPISVTGFSRRRCQLQLHNSIALMRWCGRFCYGQAMVASRRSEWGYRVRRYQKNRCESHSLIYADQQRRRGGRHQPRRWPLSPSGCSCSEVNVFAFPCVRAKPSSA